MTSTTSDYFVNNNQKSQKNSTNGFKYAMEHDSLSQDLHFKMSKKIAQLTKVIYALNTKNDDNEVSINILKHQHGKEIQQILDETNNRVEKLENKLKLNISNDQQIRELKQIISSYEGIIDELKQKYESIRKESVEKIKEKDLKHIEQIESMNQQIKLLKSSYEQLLNDFYDFNKTNESDKKSQLKNLKDNYEKEIERITEESKIKEQKLKDLIAGSHNETQIQLSKAQEEIQFIMNSKNQLIDDHEKQMKELNALFESLSMESSEKTKLLEFEIEEHRAKIFELEKNNNHKENNMKTEIYQYKTESMEQAQMIDELKNKIKSLEKDCVEKEANILKSNNEIHKFQKIIDKLESEIRSRVDEMQKLQTRNEEKSLEVASKIKQIKDLKSMTDSIQQKLTEREKELKQSMNEIRIMKEESKEMENCSKSVTTDYEIQMQSLQRALEELNSERIGEKANFDKIKRLHEIELMESVTRIKKECEHDMDKFNKKREKEFSTKEKCFQDDILNLREESQVKLEEERSKASKIIEKLKLDCDQLKNEMNTKIKAKEKQVNNFEEVVAGKEKEIKILTQQLNDNKEISLSLKKENKKLTKSNSDKESEIESKTKDIDTLKIALEEQRNLNEKIRKSVQIQEDMSEKYNKLSAELDLKWADTLRRETGRLRNDLTENFAKEKQKAIEIIEKNKSNEMNVLKSKYEDEHSKFINDLSKYEKESVKLKEEVDNLKKLNQSQITDKIQEVQLLLSETQEMHSKEIEELRNSYETTINKQKETFNENKFQYMSEMQSIIDSNEKSWNEKYHNSINSLTVEHDKKMKMKLDELENKHNRQTNDKIKEIQSQLSEKANNTVEEYKEELKSLQRKIILLEEQSKIADNNHRLELDRMASTKLKLDSNNQKLEKELQNTNKENDYLKKQIDDFGNDYNKNQKDFAEKLRSQELELKRNHDQLALNIKNKYEEETKQALNDFNKAQNLYKDKIRELNNKVIALDEQFVNRPSRDEDLETIQTINAQMRLYEKEIERLNEEKRFFQLELVNRETNFNKIFNTSPNVGILNPTQTAIKTKKLNNDKLKSFQKLTPLPGSPLHDDPINPTKPLPPSSRKSFDNS